MKKINIRIYLKIILSGFAWLHRWFKVRSLSRKYRKQPDAVSKEQRYKFILKICQKLIKLYNIDLEVVGLENVPINGSVVLTPNHKSYLDAVALIVALEQTNPEFSEKPRIPTFVGKADLKKSKTIYNCMQLLDSFFIDNKNVRNSLNTLKDFVDFVKVEKRFGLVFPEGTRIKKPEVGEFKGGAFKVVQNSYMDIIPVAIENSLHAFSIKRKGRTTMRITFLPPHKAKHNITKDHLAIASKVQQQISEIVGKENEQDKQS
ncbi:1-acyl-sn-glycerol-3-phosphate acyltransferase [Mycoplasmopsis mustelae]|uniref:1-acyl-sn-glycerol-3-phosphate acyltransferase n=1 Tax=Mycoplasmopsis mustelae TaxID=171289 RepID=A0A4R7UCQ3_9BACT|nr:lysophospholipid acyltransferase family protein [Mycoplasmopsis mustelae]TDV24207.1 1-acyl-sn-glycerol-3-phosphate acyltransferase [Mycoplasmopsis mustelae]